MAHRESYKTFERGTAAGNKLYNLYNKKNMDSTLDRDLLERLQRMRKEKDDAAKLAVAPAVVPKSRAHVEVPKFGPGARRASSLVAPRHQGNGGGAGKKREDVISAAQRREAPAPAPAARKGITAKDKLRLQHIMEFGEALPEPGAGSPRHAALPPSERERRVKHFGALAAEVAERREFLDEMKGPNAAAMPCCATVTEKRNTQRRITGEIEDRVDEMRALDEWLRARPPSQ
jgi:hypothetical protein